MNCCDDWGNCNQGRDCPVRTYKTEVTSVFTWVVKFLALIGVYTFVLGLMGYLWAKYPFVRELSCTPDLIDRIFK